MTFEAVITHSIPLSKDKESVAFVNLFVGPMNFWNVIPEESNVVKLLLQFNEPIL